jgi:hypothetical protein
MATAQIPKAAVDKSTAGYQVRGWSHQCVGCGRWRHRGARTHPDHMHTHADCINMRLGPLPMTMPITEPTNWFGDAINFHAQSGDGGSPLHIASHAIPSCMPVLRAS